MIKLKGGTASAMSAENPVLADRQPGFARTDNGGILKIGDGVTPWNDLPEVTADLSSKQDYFANVTSSDNTEYTITCPREQLNISANDLTLLSPRGGNINLSNASGNITLSCTELYVDCGFTSGGKLLYGNSDGSFVLGDSIDTDSPYILGTGDSNELILAAESLIFKNQRPKSASVTFELYNKITGCPTPTADDDFVNKQYVDNNFVRYYTEINPELRHPSSSVSDLTFLWNIPATTSGVTHRPIVQVYDASSTNEELVLTDVMVNSDYDVTIKIIGETSIITEGSYRAIVIG